MRLLALLPLLLFLPVVSAQTGIPVNDLVGLRNFAISDDGKDVYFAAYRNSDGTADQGSNIYRYQSATRATTRVTNYKSGGTFYGVTGIAYPGTGTRVAYTVLDSDFPSEEQVRIVDTATGTDRLLDTFQSDCGNTCLQAVHMTRDGTVFYVVGGKDFPFYTVKADGSDHSDMNVYQAFVAPSGQRIISDTGKVVFTSAAPRGPTFAAQASDVYVMNLDGTNIQQVTHLKYPQVAFDAVISADGSRIAYTLSDGFVENVDGTITFPSTQDGGVWTVRMDGTDRRRLSSDANHPSISADGSIVTYVHGNQVQKITTRIDILALIRPIDLTSLSVSYASTQTISGNGEQTAVSLNNSSIYLAPSGDFTVQWTGLSGLTRVYAPRVINSYAIRSAGNTAKLSVGSLMTAYGVNLGNEELSVAQSFPLPTTLGGVELWMNGAPIPLQATTPWQINAQIPQSTPPGGTGFIARGGTSNATIEARVDVLARDPESLAIDVPRHQAAAVYPGTTTVADKDHPAAPGQILELYSLGLGVTTPRVGAGAASPANPPATAEVQPRLRIGDRDAEIFFAGLVPGLAGVYQVNFRVPTGLTPNSQVPGDQPVRWVNADGSLSGVASIYVKE